MPQLEFSRQFVKDTQKWRKSGVSMVPFDEFVHLISGTWPLPARYEAHLLTGSMEGIWDVHIRRNWVVLLRFHRGTVRFLRMGTPASWDCDQIVCR